LTAATVVALSFYIYHYYFSSVPCAESRCFFSSTFEEAQEKFANAAAKYPHAKLESRHVVDDLSTQFLLFPGKSDVVLLYFAGTHGVEGYAGSAAQLAVLNEFQHSPETDPTVIFVHPLNPFGMKHFRRVNEDNIDLNRNCLTPDKFEERKNNPNIAGYEDLSDALNPEGSDSAMANIFTVVKSMAWLLMTNVMGAKRALVAAQYHKPDGVQYGGKEKSQSHRNVEEYLKENLDLPNVKAMFLLDEHTGLGPYGVDTLLIGPGKRGDIDVHKIFKVESSGAGKIESLETGSGPVTAGYDLTIGTTGCYQNMFPNAVQSFTLTQEFGTVPMPIVGAIMTVDNLNWLNDVDLKTKTNISAFAFRLKGTPWEKEIIRRGKEVFFEFWNYLTKKL